MSRPFSYNDENFTVIGNMLFCHVKITAPLQSTTNIVEIPSAIVDRLPFYSNYFFGGPIGSGTGVVRLSCGIRYDNGKYYLHTFSDITNSGVIYACTIYYLKDI